ncbi:MAG: NrfD/PsrC family molybdoenzyme membrane anchor subunit [Verrucomicrobiota bacterium]
MPEAVVNPTAAVVCRESPLRERTGTPLVLNQRSWGWITDHIAGLVENKTPGWWWLAFGISFPLTLLCFVMIVYLISTGVGVWGLNHPVGWAWDITNFVFWIGIGHAGTLISAILFLLRQKWRASVNRAAEAMTLFAVICAAIYPLIHLGRAWLGWWLLPVPNANSIWPQFRSPLVWDAFAVTTYFIVSLLFWYTGMIPDLATLRDRATTLPRKLIYGLLALGWTGSNRHWQSYEKAYLLLAGLSTPLVISVHSIVSFDFAVTQLPGWHSTLFPPYFVAGAIFSGFAMVLTLLIPLRAWCKLEDIITQRHLDLMCRVTLGTGLLVAYAYVMEFTLTWYGGNPYEVDCFRQRMSGPYAWAFWIMLICNVGLPQLFWFKPVRARVWVIFVLALLINVGMWLERLVIIAGSLARDFLPANWGYFTPTWVEVFTFVGTIGLFLTLFLLFLRFLPMIAMYDVKNTTPQANPFPDGKGDHDA